MYCISPVLCVSKCLGSKPVSCGGRIISLFIFPLLVSLSVLISFPSSHDKHSGFLIRLGKIQNLYLTPSQEGVIYISYNIVQQKTSIGSRQPVSIISITGVAFQFFCNAQTHPLRWLLYVTLTVRLPDRVRPNRTIKFHASVGDNGCRNIRYIYSIISQVFIEFCHFACVVSFLWKVLWVYGGIKSETKLKGTKNKKEGVKTNPNIHKV